MKTIFFGTPSVSMPFLARLCETNTVAAVVTQPDRPASRGQKLMPPPVKILALEKSIPVYQPEKFDDSVVASLRACAADVGVVVSYGNLIPESMLTIPLYGCFNIHFSLLPLYRGAAPIQRALMNGESVTGVTSFWLEKTLDSGPILLQDEVSILPEDDAVTLKEKLILRGVDLMTRTLNRIAAGACAGSRQEGTPTFAPSLKKDDGRIDWSRPARDVINLIRGTTPWPGAFTIVRDGKLAGQRLRIIRAELAAAVSASPSVVPGTVAAILPHEGFLVHCGSGSLIVREVQRENRPAMPAWPFLQGAGFTPGTHV